MTSGGRSRQGSGWQDCVRLSLGTLTAVPVQPPQRVTRRVAGGAMILAPLAATPLALAAVVVVVGGMLVQLPTVAVGALALGALALSSRGLHLDGLADTADGLASSYDRERALAVMRSGDVGPAGLVTTVVVVLVQVACLVSLVPVTADVWSQRTSAQLTMIAVAVLVARCALPLACARGVPSARTSGLGATMAGSVGPVAAAVPVVVIAGLATLVLALLGVSWWRAPAAAVAVVVVTAGVVVRCTRRLGGITGDVLGACVELSFTAALLVLAAG